MSKDPTEKFSDRAMNYHLYRPGYPEEIIAIIKEITKIKNDSKIADIGSGTGIFTQLLSKLGCIVYGVEPNKEMRELSDKVLSRNSNFVSVEGRAEKTTLQDNSIDLITVAQAIHLFETKTSLHEFNRILKNSGHIAFIWNERDNQSSAFQKEYDNFLIKNCPEYVKSPHKDVGKSLVFQYLREDSVVIHEFKNIQDFVWESFSGRVFSSSYTPNPNDINFEPFQKKLIKFFDKFQQDGKVLFEYVSHLYIGRPKIDLNF